MTVGRTAGEEYKAFPTRLVAHGLSRGRWRIPGVCGALKLAGCSWAGFRSCRRAGNGVVSRAHHRAAERRSNAIPVYPARGRLFGGTGASLLSIFLGRSESVNRPCEGPQPGGRPGFPERSEHSGDRFWFDGAVHRGPPRMAGTQGDTRAGNDNVAICGIASAAGARLLLSF